jgi:hypothetical protein
MIKYTRTPLFYCELCLLLTEANYEAQHEQIFTNEKHP